MERRIDSIVSWRNILESSEPFTLTQAHSLVVPSKDNITAFLFEIIHRYLIGVGEGSS
jgi:hypothetical protein